MLREHRVDVCHDIFLDVSCSCRSTLSLYCTCAQQQNMPLPSMPMTWCGEHSSPLGPQSNRFIGAFTPIVCSLHHLPSPNRTRTHLLVLTTCTTSCHCAAGSDNKGGKLEASGSFLSRMLGRSPSKGAIAPQGPAPTAGQAGKGSAAMFSSTQPPGGSLKTSINQGTASSSNNWAISSSKEVRLT